MCREYTLQSPYFEGHVIVYEVLATTWKTYSQDSLGQEPMSFRHLVLLDMETLEILVGQSTLIEVWGPVRGCDAQGIE